MSRLHEGGGSESSNASAAAVETSVGRRTLTSTLSRSASGSTVSADPGAAVAGASGDAGAGLPGPLQGRLESATGADLSSVRVHTGSASQAAAESVGANAYALGQDIHFGAGKYEPESAGGQRLIAHEVAHTVQQQGAAVEQYDLEVSTPGDSHEVEAESFAQSFAYGGPAATISPVSRGVVSRSKILRDPPAVAPDIESGSAGVPRATPGAAVAGGALDPEIAALTTIEACRAMYREWFSGSESSLLKLRDQQVAATTQRLGATDPTPLMRTILLVGAAVVLGAAAGAIGVACEVGTAGFATGAIVAVAAMIPGIIQTFWGANSNAIDPITFGTDYVAGLDDATHQAVTPLLARLTDVESAKREIQGLKNTVRTQRAAIQRAEENAMVDLWVNAINRNVHGTANQGVDGTALDDSSAGRLHLGGARLFLSSGAAEFREPISATMEGLNNETLRGTYLDRVLRDCHIIRTMEISASWSRWGNGDRSVGIAMAAGGGVTIDDDDDKPVMASYMEGNDDVLQGSDTWGGRPGASDWQARSDAKWAQGVRKAWDVILGKTLRQIGVGPATSGLGTGIGEVSSS